MTLAVCFEPPPVPSVDSLPGSLAAGSTMRAWPLTSPSGLVAGRDRRERRRVAGADQSFVSTWWAVGEEPHDDLRRAREPHLGPVRCDRPTTLRSLRRSGVGPAEPSSGVV